MSTDNIASSLVSTMARAVVGGVSLLGFPRNTPYARQSSHDNRAMINAEKIIQSKFTAYGACIADLAIFREQHGEKSAAVFKSGMASPTPEITNLNICRGTMKEWWRVVLAYDANFKVFASDENVKNAYKGHHERYKSLAPIVELMPNEEDQEYIIGFKFPENEK